MFHQLNKKVFKFKIGFANVKINKGNKIKVATGMITQVMLELRVGIWQTGKKQSDIG